MLGEDWSEAMYDVDSFIECIVRPLYSTPEIRLAASFFLFLFLTRSRAGASVNDGASLRRIPFHSYISHVTMTGILERQLWAGAKLAVMRNSTLTYGYLPGHRQNRGVA